MKRYTDLEGNSGVEAYEYGPDWIDVLFKSSDTVYRYSYASTGKAHVERMKQLADAGNGLSGYISSNINVRYESKS